MTQSVKSAVKFLRVRLRRAGLFVPLCGKSAFGVGIERTLQLMVLALCFSLAAARGQNNNDLPPGVELRDYTGWVNCLFLNASEIPVQAVVVPAVGGRIVHYSLNGTNILLENSASLGAILGAQK